MLSGDNPTFNDGERFAGGGALSAHDIAQQAARRIVQDIVDRAYQDMRSSGDGHLARDSLRRR